ADMPMVVDRIQMFRKACRDCADVFKHAVALEQLERRERGGTGQWISGVRVAVKESLSLGRLGKKRVVDLVGDERCRQREISAGDSFRQTQQIGADLFLLARQQGSRSSETSRDFVHDEGDVVGGGQLTDALKISR